MVVVACCYDSDTVVDLTIYRTKSRDVSRTEMRWLQKLRAVHNPCHLFSTCSLFLDTWNTWVCRGMQGSTIRVSRDGITALDLCGNVVLLLNVDLDILNWTHLPLWRNSRLCCWPLQPSLTCFSGTIASFVSGPPHPHNRHASCLCFCFWLSLSSPVVGAASCLNKCARKRDLARAAFIWGGLSWRR